MYFLIDISNRYNSYFDKKTINRKLEACSKACNLPTITSHGLRYTHATLLFESGASIKEVQTRLGPRRKYNTSITMDIYTHITKDKCDEVLDLFVAAMN